MTAAAHLRIVALVRRLAILLSLVGCSPARPASEPATVVAIEPSPTQSAAPAEDAVRELPVPEGESPALDETPALIVNELLLDRERPAVAPAPPAAPVPPPPAPPATPAVPPTSADAIAAEARAAFQEGVAAYQSGHYHDALRHFERAHSLVPKPQILYNMAKAALEAGQKAKACHYYASARAQGVREEPALAAICPP